MTEKLIFCAILDKKSNTFDTPFVAYSELMAKRRFILMMDEDKSPLAKWPDDFQLHKICNFDVTTGDVQSDQKLLLEAASIVKSNKEGK